MALNEIRYKPTPSYHKWRSISCLIRRLRATKVSQMIPARRNRRDPSRLGVAGACPAPTPQPASQGKPPRPPRSAGENASAFVARQKGGGLYRYRCSSLMMMIPLGEVVVLVTPSVFSRWSGNVHSRTYAALGCVRRNSYYDGFRDSFRDVGC